MISHRDSNSKPFIGAYQRTLPLSLVPTPDNLPPQKRPKEPSQAAPYATAPPSPLPSPSPLARTAPATLQRRPDRLASSPQPPVERKALHTNSSRNCAASVLAAVKVKKLGN